MFDFRLSPPVFSNIVGKAENLPDKGITIGVAMHKPAPIPHGRAYLPIHVGAAGHPDVLTKTQQDNTGDNISELNPYYCELTALYWLWKNNDNDYKGLVHYRRLFATRNFFKGHGHNSDRLNRVIDDAELAQILAKHSVILPTKRYYVIETIHSHYVHTMYAEQIEMAETVLGDMAPQYMPEWKKLMKRRSSRFFNMMIMDREHFDAYCAWIFPILAEIVRRLPPDQYDAFHARYPGRISEMLLNVWIDHNDIDFGELPTVYTESINWWQKGTSFLKAKFLKKRYTGSF